MDTNYLKKYHKNIKIYDTSEVEKLVHKTSQWYDILTNNSRNYRVNSTIVLWEKFARQMNQTINLFKACLNDVALAYIHNCNAVLYEVKTVDGLYMYYVGYLPSYDQKYSDNKFDVFEHVVSLKSFYQMLHNGFVYHANRSSGILPIEQWYKFVKDDWEVIEDLSLNSVPSDSSYILFESGGGGYVVVDMSEKNDFSNCWIWYDDSEPKSNYNFWNIIDLWLSLLLKE